MLYRVHQADSSRRTYEKRRAAGQAPAPAVQPSRPGGDPATLRGIPVLGPRCGGGAILGTQPGVA